MFCPQVALRESVYLAINVYGGMCVLGAIASFLLPIETKGRELKVSCLCKGIENFKLKLE